MKKKIIIIVLITAFIILNLQSMTFSFRSFDHQGFTRIVLQSSTNVRYKYKTENNTLKLTVFESADFDFNSSQIKRSKYVKDFKYKKKDLTGDITIIFNKNIKILKNFVLERPFRIVFDLKMIDKPENAQNPEPKQVSQENNALKTENIPIVKVNKRTEIETICIDPGHGGNDLGAVSKNGLMEKDLTLKIAKKLRNILIEKLGLRVIMTRTDDSEVSLNSRVSIANNQKAQMFVSIHINSSFKRSARGSETFYVSLKATDPEAFELAQKENQSFKEIEKMAGNDSLKLILWNMAQTEFIKESSVLAEYIQNELNILLNTKNRGVKQAPFRVLMRAAMPAVLIEVAFLSNPYEEAKLRKEEFLNKVVYAIYRGISKFIYFYNNKIK